MTRGSLILIVIAIAFGAHSLLADVVSKNNPPSCFMGGAFIYPDVQSDFIDKGLLKNSFIFLREGWIGGIMDDGDYRLNQYTPWHFSIKNPDRKNLRTKILNSLATGLQRAIEVDKVDLVLDGSRPGAPIAIDFEEYYLTYLGQTQGSPWGRADNSDFGLTHSQYNEAIQYIWLPVLQALKLLLPTHLLGFHNLPAGVNFSGKVSPFMDQEMEPYFQILDLFFAKVYFLRTVKPWLGMKAGFETTVEKQRAWATAALERAKQLAEKYQKPWMGEIWPKYTGSQKFVQKEDLKILSEEISVRNSQLMMYVTPTLGTPTAIEKWIQNHLDPVLINYPACQ